MGNPIFIHERLAKKDVIIEKKLENWTFTIRLRNHTYGLLMVKDINQLMTSASSRIIKGDNKRVCKLYKMLLHSRITKEPMFFRLIWTQQTMEMIYL